MASPSTRRSSLKRRIRRLVAVLADRYGMPARRPRRPALDVLIETILSQNTTDTNSHAAFENLVVTLGDWDAVRRAAVRRIERAIRSSGLAPTKARYIKDVLVEIHRERGVTDLKFLDGMGDDKVVDYLASFNGVGPKTAACVALFALGRQVMPVDTHILRISRRLGLIPEKATAAEAHEILGAATPPELVYAGHLLIITHGRQTCHARTPNCGECPLTRSCRWYRRGRA